jgi:protein involved in polysaccharide export with SLBB domain
MIFYSSIFNRQMRNLFSFSVKKVFVITALCLLSISSMAQATNQDPAKAKTDTTIKSPKNNLQNGATISRKEVSGLQDNPDVTDLSQLRDSLSPLERKVFGYKIFHNANTNFAPNMNMATPKNYVVGPGDILLLQVYGIAQNKYTLTVNTEGTINIPDIGLAKVGGFSIEAVRTILINKLAIRYAGIQGVSPNTFLEVTLSNIRTIKVNMVGEIFKPGTYELPAYVNVFNALFAAGGPTVKGSFRSVQVYRGGKLAGEIDLYEFLVHGKTANNIRLEDNDVILVRPASNRMELAGEVRTPGLFELKEKETFADLLKFSGGFTENAYKQLVSVNRKGLFEKQVFDLPANQFEKASLNEGDSIVVGVILDRFTNRVQISGAVFRPGPFALVKGMTVQDLIQKSGGLKGDAFLKRALLYRTKPDFTQEVITIDLSKPNAANSAAQVQLEREDVLTVASIYDIQEEYYVQINGEVNSTGIYPFAEDMTISDLVLKAEGFKYSASGSFIEIVRRVNDPGKVADIITVSIDKDLHISDSSKKIVLKPFDQVFVRATAGFQETKTVSIQGEVLYGGTFAIEKKEMRISDLLQRAGGVTKYAYVQGATLVRRTKKFGVPTISEQENNNLTGLKANLNKDKVLAGSESNKELNKRIEEKIKLNAIAVAKEQEIKNKELQKQELIKDNTSTVSSSSSSAFNEKEQELVAINLDEIIQNPGSAADLVLKDGDVLNVPEKLETVSVKGGVLYPVSVRYEPSLSFKEYINRSGGYSTRAIRNKSFVLQANGKVQRVKTFLFFKSYPKIEPGAEIFVPALLQDKPPFNYGNTVGAITGLITSTLTIVFLLKTL